ncbi:hypothetical protein GJR96_07040 [Haloferax sp. MBLA0076]|uniref:Uncharacterized protein n=1 Tax=Haloferax litoreum TaxID=2666140 RepID=A0A6A8GFZ0_9EURY|nr:MULTISPECIES: hypothetical protein [Haloferax]KAB1193214.1 hypothetical protein Hfx1148_07030 [Haloferax sp. CBA1148]MRX21711.1 hypothetical protein [Haloferax litoreum]
MVPLGRRRFLKHAGVGAAGVFGLTRTVRGAVDDTAFDPERHAFGFKNWSSSDVAYPEHQHASVDPKAVEKRIRREWSGVFSDLFGLALSNTPGSLVSLLASQLSVDVNQLAASNGHCYGMTFAAQRYFEVPGDLPDGVETASDVSDPEIPLGSDEGPIGDLIDHYQVTQLLDVHAWLGRRRMLRPRHIDYEAELAALVAVIDEFGTAGITLVDSETRASHQVLVYGYDETPTGVELTLYDPNYPAQKYLNQTRRLTIDVGKTTPVSGSSEYDAFVFNRWDRAIRSDADTTKPTQNGVRETFDHLLSRVFRVAVDSDAVSLAVVDPGGNPVGRNNAAFMDREQSDVWATRYCYDAPAGTYRLALVGATETAYDLRVQVAGLGTESLDTVVWKALSSGEVHEYEITVPESDTPSVARVGETPTAFSRLDPTSVAIGLAGGAALTYLARSR